VLAKFEFSSVVIGFLKVEMDSTPSKTIGAPQICMFDSYNMIFFKFVGFRLNRVGKTNFSTTYCRIFRLRSFLGATSSMMSRFDSLIGWRDGGTSQMACVLHLYGYPRSDDLNVLYVLHALRLLMATGG
jgi:hypothetical protein